MKTKLFLFLGVYLLATLNAFAVFEYKGKINEKQAKKTQQVEFRIPGEYKLKSDSYDRGYFYADSDVSFMVIHGILTLSICDAGNDGFRNFGYIEISNKPYIENKDGAITIFGNGYYNLDDKEKADDCDLFITIVPVVDRRYTSYILKIYKDSKKSKPIIEKLLYSCKFVDSKNNYRESETIAEGVKYFWIWLETNFK